MGDEMNLHMAQDVESDAELMHLAAVPYQIISPANNKPIIGIFQDSLLGCFRFTRENIRFTAREAMNLLMMFPRVNEDALLELLEKQHGTLTSFDVLSQIVPPMSLHYKTKHFKDSENAATSNNVLEIRNGKYVRGQMDKGVLEAYSKGLLQRICNDYGNRAASDFIDNLQNIVTEYMKSSAYSVGISDLISDTATKEKIINSITEKKNQVKTLIDQTQLGIFKN
jgi:DNA-directed RNA polymerase II subunit RPB1